VSSSQNQRIHEDLKLGGKSILSRLREMNAFYLKLGGSEFYLKLGEVNTFGTDREIDCWG
jgi:hypothetical protein